MNPQALLNHRYRVLKPLGAGGFGCTFLAEDTHMPSGRQCVIKQLQPASRRPEIQQLLQDRFATEAAVLESVGKAHSQIPTLYAYFVLSGEFYLVQEWIEGETLSAATLEGDTDAIAQLLTSLLETLTHIHHRNIIHRDIKPENIIIRASDRTPCLIDFGAVKEVMSTVLSPSGALKSSLVIGTPGFMPPEQMSGHPVFSSDLYSLGLTIISVLTGRSPTEIPNDSHIGQKLWQQHAPNVPQPLADVLTRATCTQASQRYATAQDMLAALTLATGATSPLVSVVPKTVPIAGQSLAQPPEQSIAVTELSHPSLSNDRSNPLQSPLVLSGLAIASIAVTGLFIQFRPRLLSNSTQTTVEPELSQQQTRSDNPAVSTTQSDQIPAQNSNDPLAQAQLLYEEGKNAQALEVIEQRLKENPDQASAIALKADILANQTQRDLPGAISLYTQAIALKPNNLDLLSKRCKAYAMLEDWAAAEADCTKALEIDSSSVNLYSRRGDIRTARENYEGAVNDYTQAIDLNASAGQEQQSQSLYFRRFTALGKLNRPEEALADMGKVRALPSTDPTAE